MTIPPTAVEWSKAMDPSARKEWIMDLSPLLEDGEGLESFSVDLAPEAGDLGLSICVGSGRDMVRVNDDTGIMLWFEVEEADRENALFAGAGIRIPMEVSFDTTSVPARSDQITYVLRIAQQ